MQVVLLKNFCRRAEGFCRPCAAVVSDRFRGCAVQYYMGVGTRCRRHFELLMGSEPAVILPAVPRVCFLYEPESTGRRFGVQGVLASACE